MELDQGSVPDNRNMNIADRLISEVAKRPLLWDRYDNDYNNRNAMDIEWEKIAKILGKDKEYVKYKWRNLRDQFQRESKKVKVPFANPTKPFINYYRGKWIHFEQMLFLKEIPLARRLSNSQSPSQELREDEIKEEILFFEEDITEDQMTYESDNYEKSITSVVEETEEHAPILLPNIQREEDTIKEHGSEVSRKRKALKKKDPCSVKKLKPSVADISTNTDAEAIDDDDLHFVKSLVPYFKKLTPIRKLLVRNEIHNLLIRESLCEKCKIGKALNQLE